MTKLQTPRRTQAERTRASREKITQAAIDFFARQGFRGTKLADIAKAAGLTEPGLLHHFPSKTHLLMEVLKERDRIDGERLHVTLQKNGNFLEASIELVEHNETVPGLVQLFTLLVAEGVSQDHPAHTFFIERYQRSRQNMVQGIIRAQQANEVRSDIPAETLVVMIFAMMDGLQVQWLLEPEKINMSETFRVLMDLLQVEGGSSEQQEN